MAKLFTQARSIFILFGILALANPTQAGIKDFFWRLLPNHGGQCENLFRAQVSTRSNDVVEVSRTPIVGELDEGFLEQLRLRGVRARLNDEVAEVLARYIEGQRIDLVVYRPFDQNFGSYIALLKRNFAGVSISTSGTATLSARPSADIRFRLSSSASRDAFLVGMSNHPELQFAWAELVAEGRIFPQIKNAP